MANENILFRKGTLKDLENAPKVAGSINFTTDEPAIYLDVDSNTRKRIGDLIIVKTKEELMQKNGEAYNENSLANNALVSTWSTTSLYYVENDNALLRWDGTKWKQLNPSNDDLVADLNAISTAITEIQSELDNNIYDKTEVDNLLANKANTSDVNTALNNKADKTDLNNKVNTIDFTNLSTEVGAIKDDYVTKAEKTTLEGNISKADKTATDAASAALKAQGEIDALEQEVATLEQNLTNFGSNVANVYETKQDANSKKTELEDKITTLQNGAVKTNADAIKAESDRAKQAESDLNDDIQGLDTKITNLGTSTTNNINNLKTTLIGSASDTKDSNTIYGAKAYADNAIDEALIAANAMTFKGVLGEGEGGPWATLPAAASVNAGDTYKVGVLGQYAGYTCYVGDLLIAKEDGKAEYYHISSGYEDDYNTRLGVDVANNKIKLNSPVSGELGSVKFQTDENSSLSVSVSGEEDTSRKADSIVTLSLVWGSFGTEA